MSALPDDVMVITAVGEKETRRGGDVMSPQGRRPGIDEADQSLHPGGDDAAPLGGEMNVVEGASAPVLMASTQLKVTDEEKVATGVMTGTGAGEAEEEVTKTN